MIPIEVSSTKASTLRSDAMLPVGPINFILFGAKLFAVGLDNNYAHGKPHGWGSPTTLTCAR